MHIYVTFISLGPSGPTGMGLARSYLQDRNQYRNMSPMRRLTAISSNLLLQEEPNLYNLQPQESVNRRYTSTNTSQSQCFPNVVHRNRVQLNPNQKVLSKLSSNKNRRLQLLQPLHLRQLHHYHPPHPLPHPRGNLLLNPWPRLSLPRKSKSLFTRNLIFPTMPSVDTRKTNNSIPCVTTSSKVKDNPSRPN